MPQYHHHTQYTSSRLRLFLPLFEWERHQSQETGRAPVAVGLYGASAFGAQPLQSSIGIPRSALPVSTCTTKGAEPMWI